MVFRDVQKQVDAGDGVDMERFILYAAFCLSAQLRSGLRVVFRTCASEWALVMALGVERFN